MAVVKSFKVGATNVAPNQFTYTIQPTDVFCFSNRHDVVEGVLLNVWAPYLLITSADMSTIISGSTTKNTQYDSPTTVLKTNGTDGTIADSGTGAVTLNTTNVLTDDCIIKFSWTDNAVATTALTEGRFYAYNKVNVNTAPTNTTVVAFERTASAIGKNKVGGDTNGLAWNASGGIGGRGAALSLANQAASATHDYYIGFSCKPTAYGSSSLGLILEFDVS